MNTVPDYVQQLRDRLPAELPQLVALFDCDGVLAPIVEDPATSRVDDALLTNVATLAQRAALVGIITGRTIDRATQLVPIDGIWLAALHGAHIRTPDGMLDECEVSASAREHVAVAAQLAQTVGWAFEDKGGSVTIHFRQRGTLGQSVDAQHVRAQLMTVVHPLKVEIHDAKLALEVRPRGARTKADAVHILAAAAPDSASTILYIGDDRTDLDAFAALDTLTADSENRWTCIKVAVGGDEAVSELVASADVVLESVEDVAHLVALLASHA